MKLAIGNPLTSADWVVKEGRQEAFIEEWRSLAEISLESTGARAFFLIQDVVNPRHFISFGRWDSQQSITLSRSRPRFLDQFRRCQALCEESRGSDYQVVVSVAED